MSTKRKNSTRFKTIARIVTELVSNADLIRESGWEILRERRNKLKLILLFKMVNSSVPNHLCSLVPTTIGSNSTYNLRNSYDLSNIAYKTNLYMKYFQPSTIEAWNSLPQSTRETDSLSSFDALEEKAF